MTTRTRIPAAAPAWVGSLVDAPERSAPVVHRGTDAIYLDVDGSCLGVLSSAATAVPCALRTGLARLPVELLAAETASVGAGRVRLAGSDVVIGRTVDAAVPHLGTDAVPPARTRLESAVGARLDGVRAELPEDALVALGQGRATAVPALLGRGSGLTPVGDDVLAGWLATGVAAASVDGHAAVRKAVEEHARSKTTLLSATLLACATRGDVLPEYRRLLLDLASPHGQGVDESVDGLLRVGHTSGAGLLLGTVLALSHLASRSST
jgi:hypothetical protein